MMPWWNLSKPTKYLLALFIEEEAEEVVEEEENG